MGPSELRTMFCSTSTVMGAAGLNTSRIALQRTPTDLRVVIDLKKAVTPKSFTLAPNAQYGNRLVVDLFDTRTRQAVWRGTAKGTIPSSQERLNEGVHAGIVEMFKQLPAGR